MKKKKAFTLAEVILTLLIIGVVASLTIPGIIMGSGSEKNYAGVRKAYTTVTNLTKMLTAEYGNVKFWDWNYVIQNGYLKSFNTQCSGCFPTGYSGVSGTYSFIALDGMFWGISLNENGAKAVFYVDVNGTQKPDEIGRDIFAFKVMDSGDVYPWGNAPGDTISCGDTLNYTCTAKAINDGKISW